MKKRLAGGFKEIFDFYPYLGKWCNLTCAYFSNELVQPPTRRFIYSPILEGLCQLQEPGMKQDGGHLFCRQFSQVSLCPSPVSSTRLNPVQTSYASLGYLLHRIPSSLVQHSTGGKTYFTMLGLNIFWVVLIVMSSHEQWAFCLPNDLQMSKLGVEHQQVFFVKNNQRESVFCRETWVSWVVQTNWFPDLRASLCGLFWFFFGTLPKTNSLHLALVSFPKGNSSEPTPVFQVRKC